MKYYVIRDGAHHGPYTTDQLRGFVASGNLGSNETVVSEDKTQSLPLQQVLAASPANSSRTPNLRDSLRVSSSPLDRFVGVTNANPPAKDRSCALIAIGVVGFVVLLGAIVFFVYLSKDSESQTDELADPRAVEQFDPSSVQLSERGLLEDREGHTTEWRPSSYETDGEIDQPPEGVFELVRYPAPAGKLAAYLTPDPGDGKRHPAMVWAKGGFGGVGSFLWNPARRTNDQSARAFREAGIVLMCPSWRAENDNPGRFEMFYGEVEDFLAAVEYIKTLPYVDPQRVYIGGHSTGGTISLLAACSGADVRAAMTFGGRPDFTDPEVIGSYDIAPYDRANRRENELRSAIRYTAFIRSPTFYFEGGEAFPTAAKQMHAVARANEIPFQAFRMRGNHFDILRPTTQLIAKKILADTGPECTITFGATELRNAYMRVHAISLAGELKRWTKQGGDLDAVLDNLGESDSVPDSTADVHALRDALRHLGRDEPDAGTAKTYARLAGLGETIEKEQVSQLFASVVAVELRKWARAHAKKGGKLSPEAEGDALRVLQAVAWQGTKLDGEIVADAALSGFAADKTEWGGVFKAIYTDDDGFEGMMARFGEKPPGDMVGSALLERANRAYLDDEWKGKHPYDSRTGAAKLTAWLDPPGEDEEAYAAFSAALALAFIGDTHRGDLTAKAIAHPDTDVQLEGAWSDVKTGGKAGLVYLQKACEDLEWSVTAKSYLRELKREDAIPAAAKEPEFAARAKMVDWLKHPNELGEPPASLDVFDKRELYWPPGEKRIPVWLFKFTYRFDEEKPLNTAYGMVGGTTWSSFQEFESEPGYEELYVHHCRLELERNKEESDETEVTEEEARKLLAERNSGMFR